jgi:5-methylthioadenosine/S-adenosylhomocysteine deaminase
MPSGKPIVLPEPLAVHGRLVTFDESRPTIDDGVLYVDVNGIIQAARGKSQRAPSGFANAKVVETGGVVYPGLIDLHNHIAYNCLPLWIAPDRTTPWTRRDQWPNDADYKPAISLPANALCHADGKAVLKYVETKAVVGGVTAIQGSAKVAHPFDGWMVRNVEFETFQTGKKSVNQSVRLLTTKEQFKDAKKHLDAGNAFIYHLAEGTDPKLVSEFDALNEHECLAPKFVGIHSTALEQPQFEQWYPFGGSIVWSPFSNLWLYGNTTDVVAADKAKMNICLGADWAPSGSKSLLGELKVADLYNREHLHGHFSDHDLCKMATCNPALALGWWDKLGRLHHGLHADFVVLRESGKDPYRTLVEATEKDVELVAIDGYPMVGTEELMSAANAVNPEPIPVSKTLKRTITLRDERIPDADLGWHEILDRLEAARQHPTTARTTALALDRAERPPVELVPDKWWDDPLIHPDLLANLDAVEIPPLDPLVPDAAYFDAIAKQTLHGHTLDGLHAYYA